MKLTQGAIGNLINRYRAVLKKCHLLNTFGSLAVASMLVMGGAGVAQAAGDEVLGGAGTPTMTEEVNHLVGGWLYNGGTLSPEGSQPSTGDITLNVTGSNTISEIIAGSYLRANNLKVSQITHGDITTTIARKEGAATTEFVVGGSKLANDADGRLSTGHVTLTIENGTFGDATRKNYSLVVGGNYIKNNTSNDNSATTEGSSVVVHGGTFHATVVGGSVAHNYGTHAPSVTDTGDTSVTITGGTFYPSTMEDPSITSGDINLSAAVIGGNMALGGGSALVDGNTSIVINGESATVNGKVVAGSVAVGQSEATVEGADPTQATVTGSTSLTINAGTVTDDLVGGGMVDSEKAGASGNSSLIIQGNSSVVMNGGTANGEIIGGNYVRGTGDASVVSSSVTINDGTFAEKSSSSNQAQYIVGGSKAMAYAGDTATVTTGSSEVVVDGNVFINDGAVVGGSVSKATQDGVAKSNVTTSRVTVNDGTLAGVIGGNLSETYSRGTASSSIGEGSSVVINGGTIYNIEYGAVEGNAGVLDASVVGGSVANGAETTATVASTNVHILGGTIKDKVVWLAVQQATAVR